MRCQRPISPGSTSFMPFTARTVEDSVTGATPYRPAWLLRSSTGFRPRFFVLSRDLVTEGKEAKKRVRRVCALDLGAARIGVAISDDLGLMAHPRGVFAARPRPAFLAALTALVN